MAGKIYVSRVKKTGNAYVFSIWMHGKNKRPYASQDGPTCDDMRQAFIDTLTNEGMVEDKSSSRSGVDVFIKQEE